jgi:hypothetical protein
MLHQNAIDITGRRFGRLTAIEPVARRHNALTWRCVCDCGGERTTTQAALNRGQTRSCGCLNSESHRTMEKGDRFGRLVVTHYVSRSRWALICDCGEPHVALASNLRKGGVRSCGCLRQEVRRTHGMSNTREYRTWSGMIERCSNPKRNGYEHYGGRGIKVCDRWHKFENFYADMCPAPAGLTLDRVDVNKGYEPGNCRWATWSTQRVNKRSSKVVALQTLTVEDLELLLAEKRKEAQRCALGRSTCAQIAHRK